MGTSSSDESSSSLLSSDSLSAGFGGAWRGAWRGEVRSAVAACGPKGHTVGAFASYLASSLLLHRTLLHFDLRGLRRLLSGLCHRYVP